MLWLKFRLLLWKNALVQRRHPWQWSLEMLIPLVFSAVLLVLRSLVEVVDYPADWIYPPRSIDNIDDTRNFNRQRPVFAIIAYSPRNPILHQLVEGVTDQLRLYQTMGVTNASIMERIAMTHNVFAAIEFDEKQFANYTRNSTLPPNLHYSIRFPGELRTIHDHNPLLFNWQTDKSITPWLEPGPRTRYNADGGIPPGYQREGFLAVQQAMARRFIEMHAQNYSQLMPHVEIQRFPHPGFRDDKLLMGLELILPIIIISVYIYPCINITKCIALEKERQLKEAMQIMGLPGWLHWAGWWVRALPPLVVNSALLTLVLKFRLPQSFDGDDLILDERWPRPIRVLDGQAVLPFSHWSVIFAFLLVYNVAAVSFCCMASAFFRRANVAAAMAGIVWFGLYLVYQFVQIDQLPAGEQLGMCLLVNTGVALGVLLILKFETEGEGAQWENLFQRLSTGNELSVGAVMLMLMLAALVYMLIALYVEQIMPGEYGVPKPWYFPVLPRSWCWGQRKSEAGEDSEAPAQQDALNFEPVAQRSDGRRAGIEIRGLQKKYGQTQAVRSLHLDMYPDQITVLLGHNGAGKTTTMSMLTGMITPTGGRAWVNGYDIRVDIRRVRESLGLCPQHNILFDDLTVREHMEFYARLKGVRSEEALNEEIRRYLRLLELEPKEHTIAARLSGGMKRKLSVCVAFCGGSKIVFCDEPSSGMDPAARRALWEFIRQEKRGRTVLLSTHFMDEADVLGDRIAILNAGELRCCGSSYFLKKRFGVGYHLVCIKRGDAQSGETSALTAMLQKLNEAVVVAHESASEVSYCLPDAMQADFQPLFADLEENFESYGLKNFGVTLTTLEDVFMNVGSDNSRLSAEPAATAEPNLRLAYTSSLNSLHSTRTSSCDLDYLPALTGLSLWLSQSIGLLHKRFHQTKRSWILLIVQVIIPAVFVIATICIERSQRYVADLPRLPMDLDMYSESVTLLQHHPHVQWTGNATDSLAARFNHEYAELIASAHRTWAHQLRRVDGSMGDFYLKKSYDHLTMLNRKYLIGAQISEDGTKALAWFNNQPYHSVALSLSLVHNALIRAQLGSNYSLNPINAPLPYSLPTRVQFVVQSARFGMTLGLNVAFSMAFCMAFFVLPTVREQANRAKLLQFVSGAKVSAYWATAFVWDYAIFLGICGLMMAVFAAFGEVGWSSKAELSRLFGCLAAFGGAALPCTYLAAKLFSVPSAAFTIVTIVYLLGAVVAPITVTALEQYMKMLVSERFEWAFLVMPHFALNTCLRYVAQVAQMQRICAVQCEYTPYCRPETQCSMQQQCCPTDWWDWKAPGLSRPLVYLAVVGGVAMAVNVAIDLRWLASVGYWLDCRRLRRSGEGGVEQEAEVGDEDADVTEERHRVQTMSMYEVRKMSLVIKEMSRRYKTFTAVDRISVAVDSAECFGLLGINGAGKTSTFKMLTGDLAISSGEAWVRGLSLRSNMTAAHHIIGYCPQFEALIEEMTARQTLSLFCRLRGIRPLQIRDTIDALATELNFRRHLDKQVRACSGGNRRKISTAVALIGKPAVVYLDEPTTGMDPGAKRHLWNVVTRQRRAGVAVVLTSHSMDECEALCTRLAIMVGGRLRCLGSVQHLKSKYARGYALMVKVRPVVAGAGAVAGAATAVAAAEEAATMAEQMGQVRAFVQEAFEGAVLQNQFHRLLTYYVPSGEPPRKWSAMFGLMNAAKQRLPIEDYALSQTTLEQVFMSFAEQKQQETTAAAAAAATTAAAATNTVDTIEVTTTATNPTNPTNTELSSSSVT